MIVRTTAKPGWAAAESAIVVVVASDLTRELVAEGLFREVIHTVQKQRKSLDLDFTNRVELAFSTESADLEAHLDFVAASGLVLFGIGTGFVLAFSWKKRCVCPSCSDRHRAEAAAHLVNHATSRVRQSGISVPMRPRCFLADSPAAVRAPPEDLACRDRAGALRCE